MRESATRNTPLPPSIEKAYHQKCIDLKRRLREIEDANDTAQLRKQRLDRSITKMRIMRAFLLEQLVKSQEYDDAESEKSESAPPTPREPPQRLRRVNVPPGYPRRSPPLNGHLPGASSPPGSVPPFAPSNPYAALPPGPLPHVASSGRHSSTAGLPPPPGPLPPAPYDAHPSGYPNTAHEAPLPLITSLPNGTSVMLVAPGQPKGAPWTIRDLGPQHQYKPAFDDWPADVQETEMFAGPNGPYLPYDFYGNAIELRWDERAGRYRQLFCNDPGWANPVANGVRMDAPEHGRQPRVLGRGGAGRGREGDGARERERERPRERGEGREGRERGRERERDRDRDLQSRDRDVTSREPERESRETAAAAAGAPLKRRASEALSSPPDSSNGAAGAGPGASAAGGAGAGFTAVNR